MKLSRDIASEQSDCRGPLFSTLLTNGIFQIHLCIARFPIEDVTPSAVTALVPKLLVSIASIGGAFI